MVQKKTLCAILSAVIFALTCALYVQTRSFQFINYDDEDYVTHAVVTNGLTTATMRWAFTGATAATANWHPLTMLSLLTDVSLFGVHPGAMHLHNAVLHALDAVLVFWLLLLVLGFANGCGGPDLSDRVVFAAAVATLFWSLHPLRVESVAWVSSRKDVLCVFWYLLGTLTYLKHSARGARGLWLVPVTLLFYLAAIMSKPTALVFPGTLFLAEYLLVRKIPWRRVAVFGFFTIFFMAVTIFAQKEALLTERYPLAVRLLNALAAVGHYVAATVWPTSLSVFYPYEDPVPIGWFIFGFVLLAGAAFVIGVPFLRELIQDMRKHNGCGDTPAPLAEPGLASASLETAKLKPLLTFGTLWFFVALIPVIGIIHVGEAAHADRYMYLPGIGCSILLAAAISHVGSRLSACSFSALLLACMVAVAGLSYRTFQYIGVWRDSVTLFTHAKNTVPDNHVAECNLGAECLRLKDGDNAIRHYSLWVAQRGCDHASIALLEYVLWQVVKEENPDMKSPKDVLGLTIQHDDPIRGVKSFALACIAFDRKLYLAAESKLLESLSLHPEDGYAREVYARVLLAQERYDEAHEKALQAQALLPNRAAIKKLLKHIQAYAHTQ